MKTITVQIGNSDDKLTQREWSNFVAETGRIITKYSHEVHFNGGSQFGAPWQNACWVCVAPVEGVALLRGQILEVGRQFKQLSVAFTVGETEFV